MVKSLTEGEPFGLLFHFSLPMLGSAAFQQLYNIVDSVVAGQFIDSDALAAVGASYAVTMIYTAFALGTNIGCSVVISQFFGAKKYDKMKTAVSTSIILAVILCMVLMAGGLAGCTGMLRLLSTPAGIFADSVLYLRIYTFGLVFVFLYNICTGTFTALGDSSTPFKLLIASSIGNIAADIIFVAVFNMGVAGVAWATFICQGAASLLALRLLVIRLRKIESGSFKLFSGRIFGCIIKLAIPGILQQSFISVGNLLVQRVVNSYDTAVVAGYSAAVKLNTFFITLFTTMSNSVSSFTAQNIGAGKPERISKGCRAAVRLSLLIVIPAFAAYFFFGKYAVMIFVKKSNAEVISIGSVFLKIVAPFYLIAQIKLVADGVLHGAAAVKYFMITTFTDLILRVVLVYILPGFAAGFGLDASTGIWLAWPVGWSVSAALAVVFYKSGVWKGQKLLE